MRIPPAHRPSRTRRRLGIEYQSIFISLLIGTSVSAEPWYRGGAVAAAHPWATRAALEMLDKGGSAEDAAVAAAFMMAVIGPYHSGLGGGGFAMVHDVKAARTRFLDFREVAPAAAARDMFLRDGKLVPNLSVEGGLAVAVPGAVAGYLELHAHGGRLPLRTVMAPAIAAAKNGLWVTPTYVAKATPRLACMRADPGLAKTFLVEGANGIRVPPPIGAVVKQPELARTLEVISQQGAKAFYEGKMAWAIADSVVKRGGILTTSDLATYKVRWREPLFGSYRGHRIATAPPPSGGGLAILQVLGALERARPNGYGYRDVETLHLMAESMRRAYVDRVRYLGDPAFVDPPLAKLVSDDYLKGWIKSIDPNHATASKSLLPSTLPNDAVPGDLTPAKHTTHLTVIDREGNTVALTTTINSYFGSCVTAEGTGVVLNDQMDDFATQPNTPNSDGLVTGEANAVAPGKIPLSSMSPTIVFQSADPNAVLLAVGSNGGSTITTTVLQVVASVIDQQMDLERAICLGRIHHQYLPDQLWVDRYGLEPATIQALQQKGHSIKRVDVWSAAQGIFVDPATHLRTSAADPRLEGSAAGQD